MLALSSPAVVKESSAALAGRQNTLAVLGWALNILSATANFKFENVLCFMSGSLLCIAL